MGEIMVKECSSRSEVDLVCVLSPFDSSLEGWIGTKNIQFLPRTCMPDPLAWAPVGNRVGYLGTLDHAPNLEGLFDTLDALENLGSGDLRVRVIGGPSRLGHWLSSRFKSVDYLGELDDGQTRMEASTWRAFLHPIFCHARGCSTKLATAMSWQIPIVTSTQGHRGYLWTDGSLIVRDEPGSFAAAVVDLMNQDPAAARAEVVRVAKSSPTLPEVGAMMGAALRNIGVGAGASAGRTR